MDLAACGRPARNTRPDQPHRRRRGSPTWCVVRSGSAQVMRWLCVR